MTSTNETLRVVSLQDGSSAVVKVDSANPRILEVVATFYDAARAHDYISLTGGQKQKSAPEVSDLEPPAAAKEESAKPNGTTPGLSPRQSAVLSALRVKMDENKQVEAKAAALAQAAQIPLGSLHSVLESLEKKQLIVNTRPGTPRAPAVYQVL